MSKKVSYVVVAVLAVGLATWWRVSLEKSPTVAPLTDEELSQTITGKYGEIAPEQVVLEKIPAEKQVRVALGGMGLPEDKSAELSDLVLAKLSGSKGLELIERQSLDLVLRELQLTQAGLVRANDAIRVGKLIRADWFFLGTSVRLSGTNSIVVRIVDSRSGIMVNAGVLPGDGDINGIAESVAMFIRKARSDAADPKLKTYLSIGGFQDLGLNSRQASLPRELRSYLTATLQNSSITLLEREFASTLMQEVHLDLAGLIEGSATDVVAPMQSAYWILDGFYQSYETKEFEVELVVNVQRMFGRNQQIELRDKPGEPLFQKVRQRVERIIGQNNAAIVLNRITESRIQLEKGRELAELNLPDHVWVNSYQQFPANELARRKRNTEEAIQAFKAALLLDPHNREVMLSLATCYRHGYIAKAEESVEIYRQIIEHPVEDRWSKIARDALVNTFRWEDPETKLLWFKSAVQSGSTPAAKAFYNEQIKVFEEDLALSQHESPDAEKVAEERLFRDIGIWDSETQKRGYTVDFYNTGLGKYVEAFGTNQTVAAARLVKLLPKLQEIAPKIAPHLQAGVVSFQTDTNAPIIGEFELAFGEFARHPEKLASPNYYFQLLTGPVRYWAAGLQLHGLTGKLIAARQQASEKGHADAVGDELTMVMGYSHMKAEAWQEALAIFQSYSNRPVVMNTTGPWGKTFTPVLPSKHVAFLREKLGLPINRDPREFDLQTNSVCLHTPSAFLATEDGLWLGIEGKLIQIDYDLKTNLSVVLPIKPSIPIKWICSSSTNLWIATGGAGLIDYDKNTGRSRVIREQDGLLMDSITALQLTGDTLWIGYGSDSKGGLGKLDLETGRIKSFTASLLAKSRTGDQPTRRAVSTIAYMNSDIWIFAGGELSKFDPAKETWGSLPQGSGMETYCMATVGERLFRGIRISRFQVVLENKKPSTTTANSKKQILQLSSDELGVLQKNLRTNKSLKITDTSNLPALGAINSVSFKDNRIQNLCEFPNLATMLKVSGQNLLVGGSGFIAVVDVKSGSIRKMTYVPSRTIEDLQTGGGFLWAKFDKHLHRVSLNDIGLPNN